jgi:phenylpyruvate tautomerase PptA (4-oxalocrotonate tautomerase family)
MVTIAHTTPDAVIIVFDEVPKENWAQGGKLAAETPPPSGP